MSEAPGKACLAEAQHDIRRVANPSRKSEAEQQRQGQGDKHEKR